MKIAHSLQINAPIEHVFDVIDEQKITAGTGQIKNGSFLGNAGIPMS